MKPPGSPLTALIWSKLCIAETRNVTNEVNEPVLQHSYLAIGFTAGQLTVANGRVPTGILYTKWPAKAAVGTKRRCRVGRVTPLLAKPPAKSLDS